MKLNKLKLFTAFSGVTICLVTPSILATSCSDNNPTNSDYQSPQFNTIEEYIEYYDGIYKPLYQEWYNGLTENDWNRDETGTIIDAISSSEKQSLNLYCEQWGHFWNEPLHRQQEPQDLNANGKQEWPIGAAPFIHNYYEINGDGYKYIDSALKKATAPRDFQVYHGVEWLEKEYYDQLKDYINGNDFSGIVGQTITSHGFFSTTFNWNEARNFSYGYNWTTDKDEPPLGVSAVFTVNVKKGTNGVAYVSGVDLAGGVNDEQQMLINRNSTFEITKAKYENELLSVELDLLSAPGGDINN